MPTKTELAAKVAALEARLVLAANVYREQRARIAELEAQLARPDRAALTRTPAEPVRTTFTGRDGVQYERVRTGTRAVARPIAPHTGEAVAA